MSLPVVPVREELIDTLCKWAGALMASARICFGIKRALVPRQISIQVEVAVLLTVRYDCYDEGGERVSRCKLWCECVACPHKRRGSLESCLNSQR
jgi:hypothetical protein